MDKKNPTLLSMVLVLLGIALVCSAGVAAVYNATKPVIDNARQTKKIETLSKVIPTFDNSPVDEAFTIVSSNNDSLLCYPAKNGNQVVGYAVATFSNKGYGGKIELLVGFTPDGTIYNTEVVALNETPGLGDKSQKSKSNWAEQFNGKNPETFNLWVSKDVIDGVKGSVDAITAATITSRAYTGAVDLAYKSLMAYLKGAKPEAVSGATQQAQPNN